MKCYIHINKTFDLKELDLTVMAFQEAEYSVILKKDSFQEWWLICDDGRIETREPITMRILYDHRKAGQVN